MDREDTRTDAEATNGTTQVNTNMENSGGDCNVDFGDEDCESQDDTLPEFGKCWCTVGRELDRRREVGREFRHNKGQGTMNGRLGIDMEAIRTETKAKWKRTVKERIDEELVKRTKVKEKKMKKLRHGGGFGKKKGYVRRMGLREVTKTMKRRLEMIDIGNNLGRDIKCKCGEKEEIEQIINYVQNRKIG